TPSGAPSPSTKPSASTNGTVAITSPTFVKPCSAVAPLAHARTPEFNEFAGLAAPENPSASTAPANSPAVPEAPVEFLEDQMADAAGSDQAAGAGLRLRGFPTPASPAAIPPPRSAPSRPGAGRCSAPAL